MTKLYFFRRVLFVVSSLLAVPCLCYGSPAYPRPITTRQADGTPITIRLTGDETFHYTTTVDGYPVVLKNGSYYYADFTASGWKSTSMKANDPVRRTARERNTVAMRPKGVNGAVAASVSRVSKMHYGASRGLVTGFPTEGTIRSLVILVNFKDLAFVASDAHNKFDQMLNLSGYSENRGTGSARDYYVQNSNSRFLPQFDVVGPVTVSKDMAYYGANDEYNRDENVEEMIVEACRLADSQVNFADYDLNNDGVIDNVFIYYAGYNESMLAPAETIWPHRSEVSDPTAVFDGKRLNVYACTSELTGDPVYDPGRMAGIGTFCHEFGHVLSWPDFYDTDGDKDGQTDGVYNWSLMGTGSFNNDGRTPPAISAMERMMVGWLKPTVINETRNYTLRSIDNNEAYMLETPREGEFFLLENRQAKGWDAYLGGHGMLIFHVDRSTTNVNGYTAIDRWNINTPNNVLDHLCYQLITARPKAGSGSEGMMPFPGASGNHEFSKSSNPANTTWAGGYLSVDILNIQETGGVIYFRANAPESSGVSSVEITGRNEIIVGDTARMRAVIMPATAENKRVTWSVEENGVARIESNGLLTTLKVGTTLVNVITEDGGRTDQHEITVIMKQLLRGLARNFYGQPMENVSIVLSREGKTVSRTSRADGTFEVADELTAGKYMLTVTHAEYPERTREVEIKEGVTLLDVPLLSDDERESGNGNFNIRVREYQTSAFVTWEGSKAEEWTVAWKRSAALEYGQSQKTNAPKIDVSQLEPGVEYVVRITEQRDGADADFLTKHFFTRTAGGNTPVIAMSTVYQTGDVILLKADNLASGAKVAWMVDGAPVTASEITPAVGEYEITLVIGEGDESIYLSKFIKIIK